MAKKETFAERILLKNGWQHGEGLGKNNQGMLEICINATNVILLFLRQLPKDFQFCHIF